MEKLLALIARARLVLQREEMRVLSVQRQQAEHNQVTGHKAGQDWRPVRKGNTAH